jgi:hypothetical protein
MTSEERKKFYTLLNGLREGIITDAEFVQLDRLIGGDAEAAVDYVRFVRIWTALKFFKAAQRNTRPDSAWMMGDELHEMPQVWKTLADYEKSAPPVEIMKEQPKQELIVHVDRREGTFQVRKRSLFTAILSAAAMVAVILFGRFAPYQTRHEVATLTDSMQAEWRSTELMHKGARLCAGRLLLLRQGFAELLFDSGVRIVIEAPAECEIVSDERIDLTYGRVFAAIPPQAVGFHIHTPSAQVIDLGTEFGITAELNGSTVLQMIKGKAALITGEAANRTSMEVVSGAAKKVFAGTTAVVDVPYQETAYVRTIDSSQNIVWRGQLFLDLADMVRNGNGLGTGNSEVRLNYIKGFTTDHRGGETLISKDYLPVKDQPYIDGIFIPNGRTVVSSLGDLFEEFPFTNGVYCADLSANPGPASFIIDGQPRTIQFDGQAYGTREKSCIVMQYSNHGITFDLNAVREGYKLRIDRFTSRVGLIDFDAKRCNANFYVLVDGKLRYSLIGYAQKGVLNEISIELEDTDRFLTLATSENVDQIDYMANSTLRNNWCVFAEPVLVLEQRTN